MNMKIICNQCGKRGLDEYRMALMHGPRGFRQYAVCMPCAKKLGMPLGKSDGGRQRRKRAEVSARQEVCDASL